MILVTGATGLLGTHITLELLQRGETVRCMKRAGSDVSLVERLFHFLDPEQGTKFFSKISWVDGDALDLISLIEVMTGCDSVVHTAAVVSYHKRDRAMMYKINVEGTANVLNTALELRVRKVCHISSIAALGRKENKQYVTEKEPWEDADVHTHYGITKHLSEMEVMRAVQEGLNVVILNPGFVVGAGRANRSSGQLITVLDRGLPFYSSGGTGVVAARDVAWCVAELLKHELPGERFTCIAENLSFKQIFEMMCSSLGRNAPKKIAPDWILNLAIAGSWMLEKLTGRRASITKESVKNTELTFSYSNEKIKTEIGVQFTPVQSAIDEAVKFFRLNSPA
ncbi:MAG: SDR family oxidoreductase [Flavobacteriales bacterium]|nr:SDR family oxidoreductase [Flavobacteriales bacterium]